MINILRNNEPWHTDFRVATLIYFSWLGQDNLWPCPKEHICEAINEIHGKCSVQPRCLCEVSQEVSPFPEGQLQNKQRCFTSSLGSLAITNCLLNIFLVSTLQVRVTIHLKSSKEFTSHNGGFLVFRYVYAEQNNATQPPLLTLHSKCSHSNHWNLWICYFTWQRDFADVVKGHQMRRLFLVSVWMQCNHKRETRGSKTQKEDLMREAEVGLISFEVGGRAMNQGMQAASRN